MPPDGRKAWRMTNHTRGTSRRGRGQRRASGRASGVRVVCSQPVVVVGQAAATVGTMLAVGTLVVLVLFDDVVIPRRDDGDR